MKRDFELARLKATLEAGYGVTLHSLTPLAGHAHSLNFKAETTDGGVFAAKCFPAAKTDAFARLLAHTASVRSPSASRRLFGDKILDLPEGRGWKVIALKWIFGSRCFPDALSESEEASLLRAHGAFLDGLVDDGQILPVRDGRTLKRKLLVRLDGGNADEVVRELRLMPDESLTLAPAETRIIHGDLHWENFRFEYGQVSGFLDLEELRFGTPAEDLIRYLVCRAEHQRWYDVTGRRRLLRVFRRFLAQTAYSRAAWLFAIDGYLLRKLDKKIRSSRLSLALRLNLRARFGFYRALREEVYAAFPRVRTDGRTVVKILGGTVRRFMGGTTVPWGDDFLFTCDSACQDYDWLCVYDELPDRYPGVHHGRLRVRCPKARTILLTQEPVSVKHYNAAYTHQFGLLLTNRPPSAENHPGYRKGEGYMVWYTGRSFAAERAHEPPVKTKTLSAVYSAKRMTHTQHANRFRFLELLKRELPGFDWFGKGVRPIADKCEALDDYKYHLAFENHLGDGHWTEKLADALVSGCLPFYAGDPSVGAVLPKDCFIPIPADDPARALAIIRQAIANNEYEKRRAAIAEARASLLTRYNLFAQIVQTITTAPPDATVGSGRADTVLVTRHHTRLSPSAALSDLFHHIRRLFTRRSRG